MQPLIDLSKLKKTLGENRNFYVFQGMKQHG